MQNLNPLQAPSVLKRGRDRGREVLGAAAVVVVVEVASVVVGGTNLPEVDGKRRCGRLEGREGFSVVIPCDEAKSLRNLHRGSFKAGKNGH